MPLNEEVMVIRSEELEYEQSMMSEVRNLHLQQVAGLGYSTTNS
jgi:hypothetical protein